MFKKTRFEKKIPKPLGLLIKNSPKTRVMLLAAMPLRDAARFSAKAEPVTKRDFRKARFEKRIPKPLGLLIKNSPKTSLMLLAAMPLRDAARFAAKAEPVTKRNFRKARFEKKLPKSLRLFVNFKPKCACPIDHQKWTLKKTDFFFRAPPLRGAPASQLN